MKNILKSNRNHISEHIFSYFIIIIIKKSNFSLCIIKKKITAWVNII